MTDTQISLTIVYRCVVGVYHELRSFPTRRSSDLSAIRSFCGVIRFGSRLPQNHRKNRRASSGPVAAKRAPTMGDRKSPRLNPRHTVVSYAAFNIIKKKTTQRSKSEQTPPKEYARV